MKKLFLSSFILFLFIYSFSQEELTALDLFSRLPEESFEGTGDGISSEEQEELILNGNSGIWEVTKETKNEIKISAGDQAVTILKLNSKKYQMAIVYTEYAQTSNVKIWAFEPNNDYLVQKDIFPKIVISDFYSKEDSQKIPKDYKGNISLYLYEGRVNATLWTWMESALEDIELKYNVFFDWDGENFIKKKVQK